MTRVDDMSLHESIFKSNEHGQSSTMQGRHFFRRRTSFRIEKSIESSIFIIAHHWRLFFGALVLGKMFSDLKALSVSVAEMRQHKLSILRQTRCSAHKKVGYFSQTSFDSPRTSSHLDPIINNLQPVRRQTEPAVYLMQCHGLKT